MSNARYIQDLIKKYDLKASKRFGQNFLIDQSIIDRIIDAAKIQDQEVIEIGPGLGSLTKALLQQAKNVCAYEIDRNMIKVLKSEIKDTRFELRDQDFLKAPLDWQGTKVLVSNIPYNITSDILFHIFKHNTKFSSATIMMQKEVGERLLAKVGSKNYGKLTLTTKLFATVAQVTLVPPNSFIPAPKVTSIVIKFNFIHKDYQSQIPLLNFIKLCFSFRRKTLVNNLKQKYKTKTINNVLQQMKLSLSIRPQELSLTNIEQLFNLLNHI